MRLALIGLTGAVFLLIVALGLTAIYVYQANQYVQGRGEFRNAEATRIEDRIDRVVCDILGEFPAGEPRADRLRARYDCPIPEAAP